MIVFRKKQINKKGAQYALFNTVHLANYFNIYKVYNREYTNFPVHVSGPPWASPWPLEITSSQSALGTILIRPCFLL